MNYEYKASGVISVSSSVTVKVMVFVQPSSPPIIGVEGVYSPEAFFYRLLERGDKNKISHSTPTQKVGVFLYEEAIWQI